jgi:hypothetical protein
MDLNRDVIYQAQKYISEAERILITNPFINKEIVKKNLFSMNTDKNRCMKAVSMNFAIVDRMKLQTKRELNQLRGDIQYY